jgi:hypothetical protein
MAHSSSATLLAWQAPWFSSAAAEKGDEEVQKMDRAPTIDFGDCVFGRCRAMPCSSLAALDPACVTTNEHASDSISSYFHHVTAHTSCFIYPMHAHRQRACSMHKYTLDGANTITCHPLTHACRTSHTHIAMQSPILFIPPPPYTHSHTHTLTRPPAHPPTRPPPLLQATRRCPGRRSRAWWGRCLAA